MKIYVLPLDPSSCTTLLLSASHSANPNHNKMRTSGLFGWILLINAPHVCVGHKFNLPLNLRVIIHKMEKGEFRVWRVVDLKLN